MNVKTHRIFAAILLIFAVTSNSFLALAQGSFGYATDDLAGGASVFVFRGSAKTAPTRRAVREFLGAKRQPQKTVEYRQRRKKQSEAVAEIRRKERQGNPTPTPTPGQNMDKEKAALIILADAERNLANKNYEDAQEKFEEVRNLLPKNEAAKQGLSAVFAARGDQAFEEKKYPQAISFYEKSLALDAKNADALASLGESYDALDQRDKAIATYEKALAMDGSLTELFAPLATLYSEAKNTEKAAFYLPKALSINPNDAEMQNAYGLILFNQNRDADALAAFQAAAKANPNSAEIHYNLGEVYDRMGRESDSIREYREAIKLNPAYADAYFDLGVALYNREQYDEAVQNYKEAVRLKPQFIEARQNLADAYRLMEKYPDAINQYQIVASQKTKDGDVLSKFGYVLGKNKEWNRAIEQLNKAAQINESAVDYTNLAWAYNNNRMYPEAKAAAQKAIAKDPNFAGAYFNLGNAQARLKEFSQAIESFNKALSLRREDWAEAHNNLGYALGESGDLDRAAEEHRKAIKIRPDYAGAYFNLGAVEAKRGRKKDAEKALEQLKKLNQPFLVQQLTAIIKTAPKNSR